MFSPFALLPRAFRKQQPKQKMKRKTKKIKMKMNEMKYDDSVITHKVRFIYLFVESNLSSPLATTTKSLISLKSKSSALLPIAVGVELSKSIESLTDLHCIGRYQAQIYLAAPMFICLRFQTMIDWISKSCISLRPHELIHFSLFILSFFLQRIWNECSCNRQQDRTSYGEYFNPLHAARNANINSITGIGMNPE